MNRRDLLKAGVAVTALGLSTRLMAVPASGSGRLLVVFLRGAYDAASALVPINNDFYYESRPTVAIPRPDPANPLAAVRISDDWGLHPQIARGLAPLLEKKQVVFVPFVGVPGASRSHFQVQDLVETGGDGTRAARLADGVLYRLAQLSGVNKAISYTTGLPLALRGDNTVANIRLSLNRAPKIQPDEKKDIAELYEGHPLAEMLKTADALRVRAGDNTASDMQAASRGAGMAAEFRGQVEKMAQFMSREYNLGFADIGGWDTHTWQGNSEGYLAKQFANLADGLTAFSLAMGSEWQNTQVVVVSEFGRTFRENGTGGTDHGHGSVYWVLGGKLNGAPVRGPSLALSAATLNEQRDYPVLLDYRSLLAESAAISFGYSARKLTRVFGVAPATVLRG